MNEDNYLIWNVVLTIVLLLTAIYTNIHQEEIEELQQEDKVLISALTEIMPLLKTLAENDLELQKNQINLQSDMNLTRDVVITNFQEVNEALLMVNAALEYHLAEHGIYKQW